MKKYFVRYFLLLALAIFGCNGEAHLETRIVSSSTAVNVEIVNAKSFVENGMEKSLVYGHLTFEGVKQTAAKVNLTCIAISIGDAQSEAIYVDSVAHILPDRYSLDNGNNKVAVYWKMDKPVELPLVATGFKVSLKEGCRLALES